MVLPGAEQDRPCARSCGKQGQLKPEQAFLPHRFHQGGHCHVESGESGVKGYESAAQDEHAGIHKRQPFRMLVCQPGRCDCAAGIIIGPARLILHSRRSRRRRRDIPSLGDTRQRQCIHRMKSCRREEEEDKPADPLCGCTYIERKRGGTS